MNKVLNQIKYLNITLQGHADCLHCLVRKNDIFADINVKQYEKLLKRIIEFRYGTDAILYVENSPAVELFVVRKGLVKLEETLSDGSSRIVRLVKPGGVAGLEAFLDNGQRFDQTAIALLDTEVCRIPYSVLKNILDTDPNFYKAVLNEWHNQIKLANELFVQILMGSLCQRVARVLLILIDEANRNGQLEIDKISTDDIAALTGSTRESVSRNMAEFKRNKVLTKSGPKKFRFNELVLRKIAKNND